MCDDGRIRQKPLSDAERRLGLEWLQRIYTHLLDMNLTYLPSDFANWAARETIIRLQDELHAEMRKGDAA